MFLRTALFCAAFAIAAPALANELAGKLCPLLEKAAAELGDKADYAVQADLIMTIGGAYDFDGEALRTVTGNIDASATESCPAARDALLQRLGMQSLEQALR